MKFSVRLCRGILGIVGASGALLLAAEKGEVASVLYADTFGVQAGRQEGSKLSGTPEVNSSGSEKVYESFEPSHEAFRLVGGDSAPENSEINDGAKTGALKLARQDGGDVCALLPLPEGITQFAVSLDVIPFQGKATKNADGGLIGVMLANGAQCNFYGGVFHYPDGQVRVAICQNPDNSEYRLVIRQQAGPMKIVSLEPVTEFKRSGWNRIQVRVNLVSSQLTVCLNGKVLAESVQMKSLRDISAVGLEAMSGTSTAPRTAYLDNFVVEKVP